jgi:hypothetical protein
MSSGGEMSWIKCSERLPETEDKYLVARKAASIVDVEWFSYPKDFWRRGFYDDGEQDTSVTHWQPLPDPPKDGE